MPESLAAQDHRLVAEEAALAETVRNFEDQIAFLKAAAAGATNNLSTTYKRLESEYLQRLLQRCSTVAEKTAALLAEATTVEHQISAPQKQLAAVRAELGRVRLELANRARRELTDAHNRDWKTDVSESEISSVNELVEKEQALTAGICNASEHLNFLDLAQRSIQGERIFIEGDSLRRLLWGCFDDDERLQRIAKERAETEHKLADLKQQFRSTDAALEKRCAALDQKVVGKLHELATQEDSLLLGAERLSLARSTLLEAIAKTPLARNGERWGSYRFFLGERSFNQSVANPFRQERLKKINAGLLEAEVRR